jgi:hypothetical protein
MWVYSFKGIVGVFAWYSEIAHFADHGIEISGRSKVNWKNDCEK